MAIVFCTTYSPEEMSGRAIDFVERYCSICIEPTEIVEEVDGGHHSLLLSKGPVTGIIKVSDMFVGEDVKATGNWRLSVDGRVVAIRDNYWGRGENRFRVTYTAGYEELPETLERLVEEIEDLIAAGEASGDLKSEEFGGVYSYVMATLQEQAASPLFQRLNLWRRL